MGVPLVGVKHADLALSSLRPHPGSWGHRVTLPGDHLQGVGGLHNQQSGTILLAELLTVAVAMQNHWVVWVAVVVVVFVVVAAVVVAP